MRSVRDQMTAAVLGPPCSGCRFESVSTSTPVVDSILLPASFQKGLVSSSVALQGAGRAIS